jgi:toxin CcdB
MKRFDVCPASGLGVAGRKRLVVVLQHDHLSVLGSLVVAPLFLQRELEAIARLRPLVIVTGRSYLVAVDRLASLPTRQLGTPVENLEASRYELNNALDFLFLGF